MRKISNNNNKKKKFINSEDLLEEVVRGDIKRGEKWEGTLFMVKF